VARSAARCAAAAVERSARSPAGSAASAVAASDAFLDATLPPANNQGYLDAIPESVVVGWPADPTFEQILGSTMDQGLKTGDLTIPEAIAQFKQRRIIANPNCSTIQMLVALKPLHDAAKIERINVATYQSVSGAGKEAVEELAAQSVALMSGKGPVKPKVVAAQIAFNVVPQIDKFQDNGYTKEEMKMFWETRKIFNDPEIRVNATAVRVPVFFGHSEVVSIETARKLTVAEAHKLLDKAPGVKVIDTRKPGGYPTAAVEAANDDRVFVGRIREDISHERGLNLWIVSDNIRKGAATNSVQIAEILTRDYL